MSDAIEIYRTRKGYVEFDPLENLHRVYVRRPGERNRFLCVMEMRDRDVAVAYLQDYKRDEPKAESGKGKRESRKRRTEKCSRPDSSSRPTPRTRPESWPAGVTTADQIGT